MVRRQATPRRKLAAPRKVTGLDNRPDPYQKKCFFKTHEFTDRVGGWARCGNGLIRGTSRI